MTMRSPNTQPARWQESQATSAKKFCEKVARLYLSTELTDGGAAEAVEVLDSLIDEARHIMSIEPPCRECGSPTDDGEGFDGLCGNCADKADPCTDDDPRDHPACNNDDSFNAEVTK